LRQRANTAVCVFELAKRGKFFGNVESLPLNMRAFGFLFVVMGSMRNNNDRSIAPQ
jgi:hypothetical protein